MEPLRERVPERFETERLIIRCPRSSDAAALDSAVLERPNDPGVRMPGAPMTSSFDQSEADCRRLQARFLLRSEVAMFAFERWDDGSEGDFIGYVGLQNPDWDVRRFEVHAWCRTSRQGRGYMTEAARGMARVAWDDLRARRLEMRVDDLDERGRRLAERIGFVFEGVMRSDTLNPRGEPRDTRVYVRVADKLLPWQVRVN